MTSTSRRCRTALATIVLALGMGMAVAPASADGPRSGKNDRGRESRGTEGRPGGTAAHREAVTEDNDDNDGNTANNVPDSGDNAHPSGRDRSVERGRSGNQGKSTSDPDGKSNRGPDKPGGAGGTDLADQDGNNGCGNDDDFEDDNRGRCGGRERMRQRVLERTATTTTTVATAGGGGADGGARDGTRVTRPPAVRHKTPGRAAVTPMGPRIDTEVLGISFERPRVASQDAPGAGAGGAAVLGTSFDRGGLARTGSKLVPIALAALVMTVLGLGLIRVGQRSAT